MACFLVPVAEAVVTSIAVRQLRRKEAGAAPSGRLAFSTRLGWLSRLLWGGSALMCFEHLWHGELVPFAPFLTAASDPAQTQAMVREMLAVGGTMALAMTALWAGMLAVSVRLERRVSAQMPQ